MLTVFVFLALVMSLMLRAAASSELLQTLPRYRFFKRDAEAESKRIDLTVKK